MAGLRIGVDDTDAVWPIHIDPTVFAYAWRIQGTSSLSLRTSPGPYPPRAQNDAADTAGAKIPGQCSS